MFTRIYRCSGLSIPVTFPNNRERVRIWKQISQINTKKQFKIAPITTRDGYRAACEVPEILRLTGPTDMRLHGNAIVSFHAIDAEANVSATNECSFVLASHSLSSFIRRRFYPQRSSSGQAVVTGVAPFTPRIRYALSFVCRA